MAVDYTQAAAAAVQQALSDLGAHRLARRASPSLNPGTTADGSAAPLSPSRPGLLGGDAAERAAGMSVLSEFGWERGLGANTGSGALEMPVDTPRSPEMQLSMPPSQAMSPMVSARSSVQLQSTGGPRDSREPPPTPRTLAVKASPARALEALLRTELDRVAAKAQAEALARNPNVSANERV